MKLKRSYLWWVAMVVVPIIYYSRISAGITDFDVFLHGGEALREGTNPYWEWFKMGDGYREYFYSPFFAVILMPLSYLPFELVNVLWLMASVLMLRRVVVILLEWTHIPDLKPFEQRIALGIIGLITLRFAIHNFEMVQMTIFLLWASLEAIKLAFERGKEISAGALLGLTIMIKTLPLTLLPYFIWRGKWKAALMTVAVIGVAFVFPALFVGWDMNVELHESWFQVIDPNYYTRVGSDMTTGPQSLTAMIPAMLTDTQGELDIQRNIVDLTMAQAELITNIARGILVVLTLFFLRSMPFKAAKGKYHRLWELSYVLLITPLIFPIQQKYAFLMMVPAVFYIGRFGVVQRVGGNILSTILMGIALVLLVFTTPGIIGFEYAKIAEHFKLITWGALIVMIVLMINPPPEISGRKDTLKS